MNKKIKISALITFAFMSFACSSNVGITAPGAESTGKYSLKALAASGQPPAPPTGASQQPGLRMPPPPGSSGQPPAPPSGASGQPGLQPPPPGASGQPLPPPPTGASGQPPCLRMPPPPGASGQPGQHLPPPLPSPSAYVPDGDET
jgi:hypothetical protein